MKTQRTRLIKLFLIPKWGFVDNFCFTKVSPNDIFVFVMRAAIQKYKEFNSRILSAPLKFITNPRIPLFVKILTTLFLVGGVYVLASRQRPIKTFNGYTVDEISGTYRSENSNLGVKQQAMLRLKKDQTFEATFFMDGKETNSLTGKWTHTILRDSIFDFGKLKDIHVKNYLECVDNKYKTSSKYQITLPVITAFSPLQGSTTDMLFGGMVNDAPLKKQ